MTEVAERPPQPVAGLYFRDRENQPSRLCKGGPSSSLSFAGKALEHDQREDGVEAGGQHLSRLTRAHPYLTGPLGDPVGVTLADGRVKLRTEGGNVHTALVLSKSIGATGAGEQLLCRGHGPARPGLSLRHTVLQPAERLSLADVRLDHDQRIARGEAPSASRESICVFWAREAHSRLSCLPRSSGALRRGREPIRQGRPPLKR